MSLTRRVLLGAAGALGLSAIAGSATAATASGTLDGTFTAPDGSVTDLTGTADLTGMSGQVGISGTVTATPRALLAPAEYADGRDATADLTAWLMSLPAGSTADLGGLTYRSETYVKLLDRQGLTIRNGTLKRTVNSTDPAFVYPKPNPHLWLLRPTDCTVDLKVRGCHTETNGTFASGAPKWPGFTTYVAQREFDAAVRAEQFKNVTVKMDADAVYGDGVQLQVGVGAKVYDSVIDRNGRQGVSVIGKDVLLDNVRVLHSIRSGFDLEPDTSVQGVGNIEVRNCYTNSVGLFLASMGSGPLDDVWIHHNVSDGPSVPVTGTRASNGARRARWTFEDHTALGGLGSSTPALKFYNTDDVTVRRVNLPVNKFYKNSAGTVIYGAQAFEFVGCGGRIEVSDSQFGQAQFYRNATPAPGQEFVMSGVTPALSQIA